MRLPRGSASFRNGRVALELRRGRELCGKVRLKSLGRPVEAGDLAVFSFDISFESKDLNSFGSV